MDIVRSEDMVRVRCTSIEPGRCFEYGGEIFARAMVIVEDNESETIQVRDGRIVCVNIATGDLQAMLVHREVIPVDSEVRITYRKN